MNVQTAYDDWAGTYDEDRNRTRDLDAQVVRDLLGGQPVRTALELGCGTGKNTQLLATLAQQVLALDFSPGMLARARHKVAAAHVQFVQADLTQPWPCQSAWADLAVCNLVLEHIAELDHFFFEAARCVAPGGRLLVCELHPFRQYQGTVANFARAGATTEIKAHVHHVSDFVHAAQAAGLQVQRLEEWWHEEDGGKPPRLLSFVFGKPA
jgi:ubiquinone/menaquinone biosynthesis C-methylase UbiE